MPEPFFSDHAWDYANDPEYRRRWDGSYRAAQRWLLGFWLMFFAVLALCIIY
jgi:hypothetical protein